jgi:RNA polymerase sigma-70 factor (ECF subfamily)
MAGDLSDVELMLKVKGGDREAFSVLVNRYRKPLINFAYRFTADLGVSEDLTHEVFLKVFQAASRYESTASFSTWLYRIATNTALNHLRDNKPQLTRSLDVRHGDEASDFTFGVRDPRALAEEELIERERVAQIRQALRALPENQRLAVVLTKYQDLSIKEAAEILKLSETAVKSLIFRAYSSLREQLIPLTEARPL